MRMKNWLACLAGIFLAGSGLPLLAGERGAAPGIYDFYVLSLTWSPSYCAAEGADANQQQCGRERPFSFVVHGLWPQYEKSYPEYCSGKQPDRVPRDLAEDYFDIMPSMGLIGHQWRKHGKCTGLSQSAYLKETRAARDKVVIPKEFMSLTEPRMVAPQEIEARFINANPGLEAGAIAVTCDRRYLREVRICMDRDMTFRPCRNVDRKDCRKDKVLMPPARRR